MAALGDGVRPWAGGRTWRPLHSDFVYTETLVQWLEKTLKKICMCMCISLIDKDTCYQFGWLRSECKHIEIASSLNA